MTNKKIIFGLIFLVLGGMVLGQGEELLIDLENNWKEIEGKEMPDFAKKLFGDEKINFHVSLGSEEKSGEGSGEDLESKEKLVVGLVTEEGKFKEMSQEALDNPSLRFYGSEETLRNIMGSPKPLEEFKNALDEGKVSYKAVGIVNKIKFGVTGLFLKLAGWFGFGETGESNKEGFDEETSEESTEETGEESEETEEVTEETGEKEEEKREKREEAAIEESSGEVAKENEEGIEEGEEGSEEGKIKEDKETEEETEETEEETKEELTGGTIVSGPVSHTIKMTNTGFELNRINIKAGEKVVWENIRTGKFNKAMILGTRNCIGTRSKLFSPGESFSWVFEEPGTCILVDGIMTTQSMNIMVEE